MFTPKKDILNHSKRRVLNQVCCAMGGRAAEEIEIGDVTSGAAEILEWLPILLVVWCAIGE